MILPPKIKNFNHKKIIKTIYQINKMKIKKKIYKQLNYKNSYKYKINKKH